MFPSLPIVGRLLLVVLLGFGAVFVAPDSKGQRPQQAEQQRSDTDPLQVQTGLLVIEGQPMSGPYTVWTTDGVTYVNDRPMPDLAVAGSRGRGGERRAGEQNGGAREERGLEGSEARRGRRSASTESVLLEGLMAGNLLIVQGQTCVQLMWSEVPALAGVVNSENTREAKASQLSQMTERPRRVDPRFWFNFLDTFEPDAAFLAAVEQYKTDLDALRAKHAARVHGLVDGGLSPTFTSLLAVAGSLIGIAVLIRTGIPTFKPLSSGKLTHWRHVDESGLRGRVVIPILGALVALNSLDLVFTVNAGQTSRFVELSPIAADMMSSPWVLVAFKCLCVVIAVSILYRLRQTRLAQLSAWWVCLGYTLVIIRWATVNTALMA